MKVQRWNDQYMLFLQHSNYCFHLYIIQQVANVYSQQEDQDNHRKKTKRSEDFVSQSKNYIISENWTTV